MHGERPPLPHRRTVVELLRSTRREGATVRRLQRLLEEAGFASPDEDELRALLAEAEQRGEVVRLRDDRYCALEYTDHFVGTLRLLPRGGGVVRPDEDGGPDLTVAADKLGGALDGDSVVVLRGARPPRRAALARESGEVVRVLRRRRPTVVGRYFAEGKRAWVEPFARRLDVRIEVAPPEAERPRSGEFVEVLVDARRPPARTAGTVIRRLGAAGERGVAEEVVLIEHAIPVAFPPAALEQAAELPGEVRECDLGGRADRRDQPAVTIDGETAQDFDDAIVAVEAPEGAIEVFVHIADVSHYVAAASPLDGAARERGTSVYLPGRCVPMLPERLSNGLCSLMPGVDRLTFTVRFVVKPDGGVEGYRAERSAIRSRRRCTYGEVFAWLEGGSWPSNLGDDVRRSLCLADEAARRLGARRRGRGSIDFDLPEPEILLDPEGFMTGVAATPRHRAHRLIEELMVAANECVARLLTWGRQPALFRVHDRPSAGKLAELQAVLEVFGVAMKGDLEELPPRELQRVLGEIQGRPEERFLQALILRSLARAVYSAESRGHYALATDFYLHFTSPIRRYPDLVVHRSLASLLEGRVLRGPARDIARAELEDLALHCSFTERRAAEAERETVRWKQAEFMRSRIGETFAGHVTGVVAFGAFVQLDGVFVEGLVHVSALADDYYRYDEGGHRLIGQRHGREIRLGDAIEVRVKAVNEETMEVLLEPLLPAAPTAPERRRQQRASARRPIGGRRRR